MANVCRIVHDSLPGGMVLFTDDEVPEIEYRREQIVVTQMAQAGNVSMVYIGEERYEFDIQFHVFKQSTLQNLELIRLLRDTFVFYPAIIEEPLAGYTVFWPEQPTLRERWVRGRRFAHWDHPVTWIESREITCPPPAES